MSGSRRDAKTNDILDRAEQRLVAGGYDQMSVAAIARELGVAQNSIYWYFPSKDHLFVAVLRRLIPKVLAAKPPADRGLPAQAIWFVDRLAEYHALTVTLRERADVSPVVAEFAREHHGDLRRLTTAALSGRVPDEELDLAVTAFLAAVDGALLDGLPKRERDVLVRYVLRRLGVAADPGESAATSSGRPTSRRGM